MPKLPENWPRAVLPRLMSCDIAAAYVGLSPPSFVKAVKAGVYPPPISLADEGISRTLWDRLAIDRAIDLRSGLAQPLEEDHGANIRRAIDARKAKVRNKAAKSA